MTTAARRLRTIPLVFLGFILGTILLPLLTVFALLFDIGRFIVSRRPFVSLRALAYGWVYLASEVVGVVALFVVWVAAGFGASKRILLGGTYAVQQWWTTTLLGVAKGIFNLDFDIEGSELADRGPMIVLVRHASMLDTLLPAKFITADHGIKLRYVLKRELLVDPALDIAGRRLPNHFVDRTGGERQVELEQIKSLSTSLSPGDGALIFPEGTRFTPERHRRGLERLERSESELADRAKRLERVLPPRPAGTMALLDGAPEADVVILAHHGLEVLSHVKEAWRGELVGSSIAIRFWRWERPRIPTDRRGQVDWLFDRWSEVDQWVSSKAAATSSAG